MQKPSIPYTTPDRPPNNEGPPKKYWVKFEQIEQNMTKFANTKCPSKSSILDPKTYIHRQLKTKWATEKWISIGVISLHHSLLILYVDSMVKKLRYPLSRELKSIFKKVNGSITDRKLPKFDSRAIIIDIAIIGVWKFLMLT